MIIFLWKSFYIVLYQVGNHIFFCFKKTNLLHPQNTMSRREIARQQASSSVFSWQQDKIQCCTSSSNQETPTSSRLTASHFPWELEATPSRKDLTVAKRDDPTTAKKGFTENVSCFCKDSLLIDQLKIQNQGTLLRAQSRNALWFPYLSLG